MADLAELSRGTYATYYRDPDHQAVELRWHSGTTPMSESDFRGGLEQLAGLLERERVPNVLIDVTDFRHRPSDDFSAWRDANIIPRYNAAGVRKFAFLMPAESQHTVENGIQPAVEAPGTFPTGYFASRERVYSWFA